MTTTSRKIPKNLENPLDDILIDICGATSTFYKKSNFTPNGITTLSLIFGVFAILLLYKDYLLPSIVCYIISYFYDVLDGFYARKYDMCTKFGDVYEHIKDWTINITYIIVIYKKYKHTLSTLEIVLVSIYFSFLLSMQLIFFAAQERYYGKPEDIPSLGWLAKFIRTKEQAIKTLKWVRYFGCASFILSICVLVLFLGYR